MASAAAAAGYYFYGSKQSKEHRKIAAKWAGDMKKEVIRETKRLKQASPKDFAKIVDTVAGAYRKARSVNPADLKRAASELKSNWGKVRREIQQTGVKKAVKKAVKKVGKKVRKSR